MSSIYEDNRHGVGRLKQQESQPCIPEPKPYKAQRNDGDLRALTSRRVYDTDTLGFPDSLCLVKHCKSPSASVKK